MPIIRKILYKIAKRYLGETFIFVIGYVRITLILLLLSF